MPKKKRSAAKQSESTWKDVPQTSAAVLKAVREVENFWTHGLIEPCQILSAKLRTRGSRSTKTNTDYEISIGVDDVVYKAAIKGEGDPSIRCPVDGRVWVTQPCVVCNKDDEEEKLLLCGTDDSDAVVPGCNRSHHTHCVGLDQIPEDDWFCDSCQAAIAFMNRPKNEEATVPSGTKDPEQYLTYDEGSDLRRSHPEKDLLGYVIYEDGTSFGFESEMEYNQYLGDSTMPGPIWDNGQNAVAWGCEGDLEAVRARQIHESNHGSAVFLFRSDFEWGKKQGTPFASTKQLAEEQAKWPAAQRRQIGGLTTVTARKSTGPPAPRKQF